MWNFVGAGPGNHFNNKKGFGIECLLGTNQITLASGQARNKWL